MNQSPPIIITELGQEPPELATSYRGQDFIWSMKIGWEGILPPHLFKWLVFRQAPWKYERLVLWARGDIFPGGSLLSEEIMYPEDELIPARIEPIED